MNQKTYRKLDSDSQNKAQFSIGQILFAMISFSIAFAMVSYLLSIRENVAQRTEWLAFAWLPGVFCALGVGLLGGEKGAILGVYSALVLGVLLTIALIGSLWMLVPAALVAVFILFGILTM